MWANWERVLTSGNIERLLVGDLFRTGQLGGFSLTISLGLLSIILSTGLGVLVGLARQSNIKIIRYSATVYINLFRSIPVLVIIFWAYFLPYQISGFSFSAFQSALVALTLFTSAYIAEIVRSGLHSVSEQQIQGGRALGLSKLKIYRYIVLPQAFYAMLPALAGRYIVTVKNTSLAFLIGLAEVTEVGRQINSRLMTAPVQVYLIILMLYLFFNILIGRAMSLLEDRTRFNHMFSPSGTRPSRRSGEAASVKSI